MAENYNDLALPLNPDAAPEDRAKAERRILGFCAEAHQEADTAVKQCAGYSNIVPTMQAIAGINTSIRPKDLSTTMLNEIGRVAEIMRAELTDVKPSAEFKTFNSLLQQHAINYGKMWTSWYYSDAIDRKMGGVIDYAMAGGCGYAHQVWNKFTRRIDVVPYDPRDVRPFRAGDNTLESCEGVFLVREVSVNHARAMFPHKAKYIEQDRTGTAIKLQDTTRSAVLDRMVGMSPYERAQELSQPQETRNAGMPVVDLFYFYLSDHRINNSAEPRYIGDFGDDKRPLNNYSYVVMPGKPLYPRKRLIIFTRKCVLYDGPNFYWHGEFPISKYTISPWQWTWLGKSPLWDCLSLQETINRNLRAMDDHVQKSLRPPVQGDRMSVSNTELAAISQMMGQAGAHWLANTIGKGVEVIEVKPMDPIVKDLIEIAKMGIAEQCGIRDMAGLLSLNQMPEGQTIDKLMFATKPETRSRSRMLELFYRGQGKMFIYNAAQFISTREKFAIVGPDGITIDDYDFDPATFIPNASGDPMARRDEAENHLRQFQFYVAPSSLLRSAQTQDQMMALALFDRKALDVQSLLERLDWPNSQQVMDRLAQQQQQELAMAAMSAGAVTGPGQDPRGRPPSNEHPPEFRSDGDLSYS